MEAVMNKIKEKDALLVSFVYLMTLRRMLFLLTGGAQQKNMQKPSGEQIVSSGSDVVGELKLLNTKKRNILENIQELDGQMKELAKQVTKKVKTPNRNYY